jgi:hypothetical protein
MIRVSCIMAAMVNDLPTGTVTLLFTDIEGSVTCSANLGWPIARGGSARSTSGLVDGTSPPTPRWRLISRLAHTSSSGPGQGGSR